MKIVDRSPNSTTQCNTAKSAAEGSVTSILDLPVELLHIIFSNMPIHDFAKMKEVCTAWRDASRNSELYQHIVQRCLSREVNYQYINNLVLKIICERKNFEDDQLVIELLSRSEKVRKAHPGVIARAVDDLMSGISDIFVHLSPDLPYMPHISQAARMPCIRKAAENNNDNQLAKFILALPEFPKSETLSTLASQGFVFARILLAQHGELASADEDDGAEANLKCLYESLRSLSDQGHAGAKVQLLGLLELAGDEISEDSSLSLTLLKELAASGHPFYQVQLALSLEGNKEEAIFWLHKAAAAANLQAQFILGTLYHKESASGYSLELAGRGEEEVHFFLGCKFQEKDTLGQTAKHELHMYSETVRDELFRVQDVYKQLSKMYRSGNVLTKNLNISATYESLAK